MRNLFIPSRRARILDALNIALCSLLLAAVMAGADTLSEGFSRALQDQPTYASFGYTPDTRRGDTVARALADSIAADTAQCRELHGPEATALQLPDGSHRCVDHHGRRLSSRSAISIPSHAVAQR